jgi:hypothetical protein
MVRQRLLKFDYTSVGRLGVRLVVVQNVIDYTETLLGILGVVCKRLGDINLQIVPRWSKSCPLDRFHGTVANVVVVISNDDNSLCFLFRQNLGRKAMRMAIICARLTDM